MAVGSAGPRHSLGHQKRVRPSAPAADKPDARATPGQHRAPEPSRREEGSSGDAGGMGSSEGPGSLGERWLSRRSLVLAPQNPPPALPPRALSQPHGRRGLGSPSQHHLVFSSCLAVSSPLPPSPAQTPRLSRLGRDAGRPGGWCLPSVIGAAPALRAERGQTSAPAQLQEQGGSQAAKLGEKTVSDEAPGPRALPFMAALSAPSLMQDVARGRESRQQPASQREKPAETGEGRSL